MSPHSFAKAGRLGAKTGWEICVLIDGHRNGATFILKMRVEAEGTVTAPKSRRQRPQGETISYLSSSNREESPHDGQDFADVHVYQVAFLR